MKSHAVVDVSSLPSHGFDSHAPLWWGNLMMILIESTMMALVAASYFYLRQNFDVWPPPRAEPPSILRPLPELGAATANLLLLLGSCVPMFLADRAARRDDARGVGVWFTACIALGIAAVFLRSIEFSAVHFRWDSNAYGSVVWTALGFHLMHLIASILETLLLVDYVARKGLDTKHALDATVNAVYWYWMAGVWVPFYAIIYLVPRLG